MKEEKKKMVKMDRRQGKQTERERSARATARPLYVSGCLRVSSADGYLVKMAALTSYCVCGFKAHLDQLDSQPSADLAGCQAVWGGQTVWWCHHRSHHKVRVGEWQLIKPMLGSAQ